MFEDKKIFILGMARSGYEVAKLLKKRGNKVILNDSLEEQDLEHIEELKKIGVEIVLGSHPDDIFTDDIDYLVKNPGIKNDHKYVLKANEYNIPVINEIEVAYLLMPKDIILIGITGSNGKTTTASLVYEIIRESGRSVHLTGNIGLALSKFVDQIKSDDIVVTEVSVQQLCNVDRFKTNISVLTNIYEAHLDFVDGFENYLKIKKRIFNHQNESDYATTNYDNSVCMEITKDLISHKEFFSNKKENVDGCYIKDDSIYYYDEKIIGLKEIMLKGMHNYENIMAAILVVKRLNIDTTTIVKVLKNFGGVEHRVEFVKSINNITFYNDSKSTNIVATQTALKSFSTPVILLLGGLDRGQGFDSLKEHMKYVKLVICYGETKNIIKQFCEGINIKCIVLNTLEEATKEAYKNSISGDTILLSPACASWDQYKSFEERGEDFKEIIEKL